MRLTRAAEYAIRCMVYLAKRGQEVLTSRQEIAEHVDIPTHFLAKIAQDLAKAGLIEIKKGARGGFLLSHQPEEISLLQVVETMIGEIFLNDCIGRPSSCKVTYNCTLHRVWMEARDQLRDTLGGVSFAQLVQEEACIPVFSPPELSPADSMEPVIRGQTEKVQ